MDWSEEGFHEEEQPSLRRRSARRRSPPAPHAQAASGSRSPSPRRGGLTLTPAGSRSPSPRRAGTMATRLGGSVRATRRSPPPRTPGGADAPAGAAHKLKVKEGPSAAPRDHAVTSASGSGCGVAADEVGEPQALVAEGAAGRLNGISSQEREAPQRVDGSKVRDAFAGTGEVGKAKAKAEFTEASMGASRRGLDIRARPVGPVSNKVMENPIVIASRGKVTLGRETEDVKVDIDLGKEGRANKISRRQVTLGRGTENVKVDIDLGKEGRANKISHRQESGPPVKTIASSTRNDGTPNVPHPLTEIVQRELIDTKNIMNARFVEDWLVQRENESDEEYFQTMATLAEVNFWERMRAEQNNAALQQGQQNVFIAVDSLVSRTALRMLQCQMRKSGFELEMIQLIRLSMKGVSVLIQFLCYNCLHNSNAQADKVALKLLGAATTVTTNTRMMSDLPGFIAILVLRSYTGNDDSQTLCLELLVVLSRLYCNKVRIISMGGFYSALWHLLHGSEHKGKIACRLIESLMDTEEGKIKFIKDRAAYHLIRFTIASGAVTPWIGGVVQGLKDFSLGQTRLLDALTDLPVGHFVRQRLTWCLLDSVEEDEKYRFYDKFED